MTIDERFPGMDSAETYRTEADVLLDQVLTAWGNGDSDGLEQAFDRATDAEIKATEHDLSKTKFDAEEAVTAMLEELGKDPNFEIPKRSDGEPAEDYLGRLMGGIKPYPTSEEQ